MQPYVLVTLTRSGLAESEHRGAYCVLRGGRVERSRGDLDAATYFRSSCKPVQALAVVESGAADRFGLTEEELALTVGSHDGSPHHAETAASILRKAGAGPELLRCGGHPPLGKETAEDYLRRGIKPGRIHDNCSGKHAGMIAAARALGADPTAYADAGHPVQRRNLDNIALYAGVAAAAVRVGTDGCAAPTFAVPLRAMALLAARAADPYDLPEAKAAASRRIRDAVIRHPDMIAGPKRFDTRVIRAGKGKLLSKMGAEGVLLIGVAGERMGIAIKIADGGERAVNAVAAALLVDLGLCERADLADHLDRRVLTREGTPVGDVQVAL
ncbi:MAG: asparaginase [Planctomycetaceae bacterium]